MDFSKVKSWTIPEGAAKKAWINGQLVWQSEAPKPYDAEIQWLRNNGDCSSSHPNYIQLWHVPSLSSRWEIRYQFDTAGVNTYIGSGAALQFFRVGRGNSGTTDRFVLQLTSRSAYSSPSDGAPHVFVLDAPGERMLVDGVAVYEGALGSNINPYAPLVFNFMSSSTPSTGANAQHPTTFYYSKWYENGVLVEDVIPVRIGQTGYLYDKVSGELHGNMGDGTLTLGPDVNA